MQWLFALIDKWTERSLRRVAHRHGRRSLLARLGVALVGGAALPMLPFDRSGQFTGAQAAGAAKKPQADPARLVAYRAVGGKHRGTVGSHRREGGSAQEEGEQAAHDRLSPARPPRRRRRPACNGTWTSRWTCTS